MTQTPVADGTLDAMARWVGSGEAAEAVGVSRNTLERWAREGRVTPAIRTAGGHYRWDIDELQRQLREREYGESTSD